MEKKCKTSDWNEMVEMTFQPLLTYFFAINTFICCVIKHRICIQNYAVSGVSLVDIICWYSKISDPLGNLHCYDLSPLQQIYPT